jgi:adenylate cyclase
MGIDEEGTLSALTGHHRELVGPCIAEHEGRVVKTTGDGLLAEFASAVDAVICAVALQDGMRQRNERTPPERRIAFRIGVNLGDVIVQGDDIFGDGVNVAARLEAMADAGGICISASVGEQVEGRIDIDLHDLGMQRFKNISRPVRVYAVRGNVRPTEAPMSLPPIADKPSVAVLPFDNMSSDPGQEYFSDGMTEDIITGLSRFHSLFVIARNSSFAYKGRSPDVRDVARELGVRYVVEGSVRRLGTHLRTTAQLVNAKGIHLWAERYDRELDDIFVVQDEITTAIVAAIAPEIGDAERARARRKPPDSLDAWGLYQRALATYPEDLKTAIEQFDEACQIDRSFGLAFAMAANARARYVLLFDPDNPEEMLKEALTMARTAITLDAQEATCHWASSRVESMLGHHDEALESAGEAIRLNPNDAMAHYWRARALGGAGRLEEAIPGIDKTIRLSPHHRTISGFETYRSFILFDLERYEEALKWARRARRAPHPIQVCFEVVTASLAELSRRDEAREALKDLLEKFPEASINFVRRRTWIGRPESKQRYLDALREAGLPE